MTTMEQIPQTYEEAVRALARWQGESGDDDLKIYSFPDPERNVVRLLHVSDGFPDGGGVTIYKMGRSDEFPFKSAVGLAQHKYWDQIQAVEPVLPSDWNHATAQTVWPDGP